MPTECSAELFEFARVERRSVVAAFDGGKMTSDAGGLLLGASDRAIGLIDRFASCFTDSRLPELVEHRVATLIGQRIFGIALGYEDVVDHDVYKYGFELTDGGLVGVGVRQEETVSRHAVLMLFSLAIGRVSRKVCIGVLP